MVNNLLSTDEGAFWPRLQCFVVLLERLGNRIWQISALLYKPHQLFRIITENHVFHNAIMQWKNNEFEVAGFSQEVFGELRATRKLSSSSDTKYSSRFYKTALAWFQPFVQSLLDFEPNGDCLSHVIEYLHFLAGKYHYFSIPMELFSGFCSSKQLGVFLLHVDGMLDQRRVTPRIC